MANDLKTALANLLKFAERNTCQHDETHRGGAIWTICNACGKKWADDQGGYTPFEEPAELEAARLALTSPVAPEQVVAAVQRIDSIAFTKIAARHLPGDMDPHDAWLFFQEASRAFFGKEIA